MASILNISVVHLGRLAKEGSIPGPVERGRWDVATVVQGFVQYQVGKAREGMDAQSEEMRLMTARREKTEAERDAQEMKNARERGELLPKQDVHVAVTGAFARVRAKLIALPSKIAPVAFGVKSIAELRDIITKAIHEALAELASTSIAGIPAVAAGGGGDIAGGAGVVDGADAAAEPDGKPVGRSRKAAEPRGKR